MIILQPVLDFLLWHHLGPNYEERAHDLLQVTAFNHFIIKTGMCAARNASSCQVYKQYFSNSVNGMNLAPLVEQYIWRTEIPLTRC